MAAATLLAACTGEQTVAGTATSSVSAGAPTPPAPPARVPAASDYVDITGQVAGERFVSVDGDRFQVGDLPGSTLVPVHIPDTDGWSCTLGSAVAGVDSEGFLTAGHCYEDHADTAGSVGIFADAHATAATPLGGISGAVTPEDHRGDVDYAVIWTPHVQSGAVRIAGHKVAGVMPTAEVKRLAVGTPICWDGSISGVRCGHKLPDTDGYIAYSDAAISGDSGAPVFVVDHNGDAVLIGIVRSSNEVARTSHATYLEPALRDLRARVLTDPGADPAHPEMLGPGLAVSG